MQKYSQAYGMFSTVLILLLSTLVHAADSSRVFFHFKCSETIDHDKRKRDVVDERIELSDANIYKSRFQSKLSPTRSAENPVDIELTLRPTIFSGKIHSYVRLDAEVKSYDPFDNQLLHTQVWPIHLIEDGIAWHKERKNESLIFDGPAFEPALKCETNLIAIVPGAEMVMPERINFQAQIRLNSDFDPIMSPVTNCSLTVGESCEIYLHTAYNEAERKTELAHIRREITLIDVAIDAASGQQVLFFKYQDVVRMRQLTPDFSDQGKIDWVWGETLYVKSHNAGAGLHH